MRKLAAFTLMELLVGMIISSIVIGFGYSAYDLIYKQYLSYKLIKNNVLETMQFNTVMNNDFVNSQYIIFEENKLKCNTSNKLLTYNFMDSFVVRTENEISDTFKLATGNILVSSIFVEEYKQGKLVKNFLFDVFVFDTIEHFTFTKSYSAQTLMTYEMQNQLER